MRFHRGLAMATAEACAEPAIERVVLSGGVFQNRVLLELTIEEFQRKSLPPPLLPLLLPANDGAISYGQAAIAACSGQTTAPTHSAT
jgi:hydrogenase maturation protein HypF